MKFGVRDDRIKEILHEIETDFQHLVLVDTHEFGKMLQLDGLVQTTLKDEFIYHEMMTHVPLISHSEPSRMPWRGRRKWHHERRTDF